MSILGDGPGHSPSLHSQPIQLQIAQPCITLMVLRFPIASKRVYGAAKPFAYNSKKPLGNCVTWNDIGGTLSS
jgi:hypothetical protein